MASSTDSLLRQMEIIQAKIDENSGKMKRFDNKVFPQCRESE